MRDFKIELEGDSAGVTIKVRRVETGRTEFNKIDLNPKEFEEFALVVQREMLRRKAYVKPGAEKAPVEAPVKQPAKRKAKRKGSK